MSPADDPASLRILSTGEMAIPRRLIHHMTSAQRGALLAVLGTAVLLVIVASARVRLGFGVVGDIVIGLVTLAVMSMAYAYLLVSAAHWVHRFFTAPRAFIFGILFSGAALLGLLAGLGVVRLLAAAVLFTAGWWGATIASLWSPDRSGPGRRPYVLLAVAVLLTVGVVHSALAPLAADAATAAERDFPRLAIPGNAEVLRFRYGSGPDARRAARYGRDVAVATSPVDLQPVLPAHRGVRKLIHAQYWGIDVAAAPVNATVWMPRGSAPVPVALLLHGAGVDESSEEGLGYLGEHLASHGIAAVSIDANPLSGPWIREGDGGVAARERLVVAHLMALDSLDRDARSPFAGRLDRRNIVLIGHSRGGEAMVAVAMNRGRIPAMPVPTPGVDSTLVVRAVVALSPTEGLLLPNGRDLTLENVSYLLIRGSQDADVPPEAGAGQYSRIQWTEGSSHFKSAVVLEGANHSQFNARWGRRDIAPPLGWLLRDAPVLDGHLQRDLTAATVLAFVDDVLEGQPSGFRHFQEQLDGLSAASGVKIRRRLASAQSTMIETFEADADPYRGEQAGVAIMAEGFGIWREWRRRRTSNSMVQLVWPAQPDSARFTLRLALDHPAPALPRGAQLVFAAVGQAGPQELRVEVETRDGRRASTAIRVDEDPEFSQGAQRYRSRFLEGQLVLGTFPSLHTYVVPLDALSDGAVLREIRFLMPAGRPGAVMLDDIGIRQPPMP